MSGLSEEVVFKFAHLTLPVRIASRFKVSGLYEGADAASSFDDAEAFELGIDFCDGIGVYAEFDGKLSDGGQLVPDAKLSGGNSEPNRSLKLMVERRRVPRIDVER